MDISIARYLLCDKGFSHTMYSHIGMLMIILQNAQSHISMCMAWFPYSHMVIWYINDLYINDEFTCM